MSIKIGNIDVSYFKVGGDDASIYIGSEKLYPEEPSSFKYMLTLSDSTTASAECDSTSAITQDEISAYTSTLTTAEIGDCVSEISDGAFYTCMELANISIPNSVTTIGNNAFNYCYKLASIDIPNSVTTIGNSAFYYCRILTSVDVPNSVTTIGSNAFQNCNGITSCTIGSGVTTIGSNAFLGCSSITNLAVDSNNTAYDSRNNCNALIETSTNTLIQGCNYTVIPSDVTSIGNSAFEGCSSLTSVNIPSGTTFIGDSAFNGCNSITSIDIPSGVTSIGSNAFYGCSSLTSITVDSNNAVYDSRNNCNALIETSTNTLIQGCNYTVIPNNVTAIGSYAFNQCSGLTSVTIPSGVTSIGRSAFYYCSGLTSVSIPSGVTSISDYTFSYCSSLTSIDIPSGVTSIGAAAFLGCSSLASVTIPDSITTISRAAFQYCSSLTSVTIPSGVTTIGNYAFYNCSGLTSIDIPSGVTSIGSNAFYGCSSLTSITVNATTPPILSSRAFDNTNNCPIYVPSGSVSTYKLASVWRTYASRIQAIPTPSFKYNLTLSDSSTVSAECNSTSAITQTEINTYKSTLVSAEIGNCVTSIGNGAFDSCTGLTSVTIPDSVTSISRYAFSDCSGLTSVNIPSGVTSIGNGAFDNTPWWNSYSADTSHHYGNIVYINDIAYIAVNTDVTSVAFKNGTKSISDRAFLGCSSLTSIDIPDSVTSIGNSAFRGCSGLTSIDIPDSVTSIGNSAFYNCSGLASVTVNATTPPTLGNSAFNNTNICPIYVPSGSVQTFKQAEGWSTYASRIEGKGIPHDYSQDYLTFVVENNGTIVWKQVGTGSTKTISYSKDSGSTWTSISSTTGGTSINVSDGDIVWFKGTETAYAVDNKNYSAFESGGTSTIYRVEGNIMSLLYGDNFVGQTALTEDFTFCSLFKKNTNLYNAENLILPSTSLRESCYRAMFSNCSIGTGTLPKLPATTLAPYCYYFMFEYCKRLSSVPTNYLPVTTLATNCYSSMFKGCSRLTTAPQLPATTLTTDCYNNMFSGCTSLSAITCLATDISASNCTTNWLKGVAANGTFTKSASMNDWSTGVNGIPSRWTVTDYT